MIVQGYRLNSRATLVGRGKLENSIDTVSMPLDAEVLSVTFSHRHHRTAYMMRESHEWEVTVWVLADLEKPMVTRSFLWRDEGESCVGAAIQKYVGYIDVSKGIHVHLFDLGVV